MLRRFIWLVLGTLSLSASAGTSQADDMSRIGRFLSEALSEAVDCESDQVARVGIWPFDQAEIPIDLNHARLLYRQVLSELLETLPSCVELVDVDGLRVSSEILRTFDNDGNGTLSVSALASQMTDSRYFVSGVLQAQGTDLIALFRLTDHETGAVIASPPAVSIPLEQAGGACGSDLLSLDVALSRMADDFEQRAPGMRHMIIEGGFYANTNGRTEFSQYLETLLTGRIAEAYENMITGRALSVENRYSQDNLDLLRLRGLSVSATEMEETAQLVEAQPEDRDPASVYRLSFRYWPCEDALRLSATLTSLTGATVSWIGNLRRTDVPEQVSIEPPTPTETRDWGPDGAFTFQMTSQRGTSPSYRPGEAMQTVFRLSRDAWLYCFYTDSEGQMIQILPNRFQVGRDAANFYEGGRVHLFPDPERLPEPDPFELTINAETYGIEVFRCIATSRDITADLPEALRGRSFDPIPARYASRLREVFEALEGASISTASITLTVIE